MTPEDFFRYRMQRGLSQEDMGRELGVTGRQVRNWEAGRTPVPVLVEKLIEQDRERRE
jgi:transcriptional regulator with XRE-family HTH domain